MADVTAIGTPEVPTNDDIRLTPEDEAFDAEFELGEHAEGAAVEEKADSAAGSAADSAAAAAGT